MGKFTSGPDWIGVSSMTKAIEALHSCTVEWIVRTTGRTDGFSLHIHMTATFHRLPGSSIPAEVTVSGGWPHSSARTLAGLVYNLLWQLDYAIQLAYEQMVLPEA
jgi:hypothetical protein